MGTEEDLNQPTGLRRIAKRIRNLGPLGGRSEQRTEKAQMRQASQLRKLRQRIEATHLAEPSEESLQLAISKLGHSDRGDSIASRIALEHQPVDQWRTKLGELTDSQARILAVVALARNGGEADHQLADTLQDVDWSGLSSSEQIDLLRAYGLIAIRLGAIEKGPPAFGGSVGITIPHGAERS